MRKSMLLVGVPVGLAAAGALTFYQLSNATPVAAVPDPGNGQHGPMVDLEERVINLRPGGTYRYAKVGVTVELRPHSAEYYALTGEARAEAEEEALAAGGSTVPLLLDALGSVVSAKSSAELAAPDGRATLKAELLAAMRRVVGEREVLDIYFTDLVMQ